MSHTRGGRQTPREILRDNAGARFSRKNRKTGTIITVYRNDEADLDDDEGRCPYSTVCEDHGTCVAHPTLTIARDWMAEPDGWCEVCREIMKNKNLEGPCQNR